MKQKTFSDAMQKAAIEAAITAFDTGRVDGGKSARMLNADILRAVLARIERAEAAAREKQAQDFDEVWPK